MVMDYSCLDYQGRYCVTSSRDAMLNVDTVSPQKATNSNRLNLGPNNIYSMVNNLAVQGVISQAIFGLSGNLTQGLQSYGLIDIGGVDYDKILGSLTY